MALELIGKKVKMGNIFREDGSAISVTFVELYPLTVTYVKRQSGPDGYSAIQVGYGRTPGHRLSRPEVGHLKSIEGMPFKHLMEMRVDDPSPFQIGQVVGHDFVKVGDKVKVVGTSKGKGFAGVVKRYHFRGAPRSHGTSMVHRKPMSGGATDAARVFKGTRKPGHMGAISCTVKNQEVVLLDEERGLLAIRGAVPGPSGGLVRIIPQGAKQGS
jgi:large subunit ribosomal protein L3